MGFFSKFKKKDDDLDFSNPPDFSDKDPFAANQPFNGKDPLQKDFSYDAQASLPQQKAGEEGTPSNFDHDLFSSSSPTEASNAQQYAKELGSAPHTQTYAGAITGHESQLILERLDTIKAELDSIKQRMIRIDRYMDTAEEKGKQRRYF